MTDLEAKKALYDQVDAVFDELIAKLIELGRNHKGVVDDFAKLIRIVAWGKIDMNHKKLNGEL